MKEEIVSFQVAKLAKEKGFDIFKYNENLKSSIICDEDSFYVDTAFFKDKYYAYVDEELYLIESGTFDSRYGSFDAMVKEYFKKETNDYFQAPTQSLLQKWLREVHKINVESNYLPNIQKYGCLYIPMTGKASIKDNIYVSKIRFNTYEEALEEGLKEALKLIKNENK